MRAALTFRSGNSSRWAPYCWPSSPVNPVRIPAGAPIHSHFLDTPFLPWHPAYVAPFRRNGQYFLCECCCTETQNNGCATTADQAIGRGSQSVKWKPAVYNLMDPQFVKLYWIKPKPDSEMCRRNLFNPCVRISKNYWFSARPRSYYFSANPMTSQLMCH